jgi:hypothetical protein
MTYFKSWEEFEKAAERLYLQDPIKVCFMKVFCLINIIYIHYVNINKLYVCTDVHVLLRCSSKKLDNHFLVHTIQWARTEISVFCHHGHGLSNCQTTSSVTPPFPLSYVVTTVMLCL